MSFPWRQLDSAEIEEFLKENSAGVLCFGGAEPYGVPMGFKYRNGLLTMGFGGPGGRKLECAKKSPKVCFTVTRPRKTSPNLKDSCTTVMFEGELEKVTDLAAYGLDKEIPKLPSTMTLFVLRPKKLSSKKCLQQPCELLAGRA